MNTQQIDRMLSETLEDLRLSRGERRALKAVLADEAPSDQQIALIRSRAFALAKEELTKRDDRQVVEWLENVVKVLTPISETKSETKPSTNAQVLFSPGTDCLDALVDALEGAKSHVDICVFTITDNRVARPIVEAHRRGVKVRIVTDDDKSEDRGSDVDRLAEQGVPVRFDQSPHHMHHKFAVFDRRTIVNGSYNWTRSAAEHNRENIVFSDDPAIVGPFQKMFDSLWDELAR